MHNTLSADSSRSAAAWMLSAWMRAWVSRMASISAPASLLHKMGTLSVGWISPERGLVSGRAAVEAAMDRRKALYPWYPIRRQKREMVASATPQAAASSEMDMLWVRWPLATTKLASFFSEEVSW